MGTYAFRHSLQGIIDKIGGNLPRLFSRVLPMAADQDKDPFEHVHKYERLGEIADRVTVYCNSRDCVLSIGDLTKGNPPRLGFMGPKSYMNVTGYLSFVDCHDAVVDDGGDTAVHYYYPRDERVRADMLSVLADLPPGQVPGRCKDPENQSYVGKSPRWGGNPAGHCRLATLVPAARRRCVFTGVFEAAARFLRFAGGDAALAGRFAANMRFRYWPV